MRAAGCIINEDTYDTPNSVTSTHRNNDGMSTSDPSRISSASTRRKRFCLSVDPLEVSHSQDI